MPTTTPIETRPLGHSGIQVSVCGLGTNQFGGRVDLDGVRAILSGAIEAGVTFIDCADTYGKTKSEAFIGEALKGRRDEVVISTKFGKDPGDGSEGPRGSAAYIKQAAEKSLRRLQTDTIDLYWYHEHDGVTPLADTLGALDELVRAGKVRSIGISNASAELIREADAAAKDNGLTRFTAVENRYNLLTRGAESDVLPLCQELDLAFIPFPPLAGGLLTGKYQRGVAGPEDGRLSKRDEIATDEQWDKVEALTKYAEKLGVPLTYVAIGGLLTQPAISSVICGATRPEQVRDNAAAAAWTPSESELNELRSILG